MFKEFKEFAFKGNLIDTAVAFVMGAAFGKVISGFIDGIVMPLVGLIQGKDFSMLYIGLNEASKAAASANLPLAKAKEVGPVIAYGDLISILIQFIIVAFVMFVIMKAANKAKLTSDAAPAAPAASEVLLADILATLKQGK
jgi:large conductance mechanosensitive channel